jgi:hypothetical protein
MVTSLNLIIHPEIIEEALKDEDGVRALIKRLRLKV